MVGDSDSTIPQKQGVPSTVPEGISAHPTILSDGNKRPVSATVEMKNSPERFVDPFVDVRIDNYEISGVLGEGGFGKVYKARDVALGRYVAVKFLRSFGEAKKQALFEREAKAIAALSKHPNIVDIYHWGEYCGQNYFVLEYVESSAAKLIEEHPEGLPLALALRITAECADALQEAHKNSILHRDVKPANILIESETNQAKLTDFGLARTGFSSEYTLAGTISGSPSFMSPEQANAEPLDGRSDIFSLGVTMYELLSGDRPFDGHSSEETMARIRRDERIPLRARRPDLPEPICAIVDKATAHAREDRYQTAGEFARQTRLALQSIERSGHVPSLISDTASTLKQSREAGSGGRRAARLIVSCAALVLALSGILLGIRLVTGRESIPPDDVALSMAKEYMNRGDFADAVTAYQKCLQQIPESARAWYGLGLALIGVGRVNESEPVISKISVPGLKSEAQAAEAFATQPNDVRARIETSAASSEGKYPEVLLAKLDLLENAHEQAARRVAPLGPNQFNFGYQYAEALQTLGQANYQLGKFSEAKEAFERLSGLGEPQAAGLAKAYLAEITQRLDENRRGEIHARALEIKKLLESGAAEAPPGDDWSSRPLTFFVLPSDVKRSQYALKSGLADLLPMLLGDQLDADTPMNLLDRALINEILSEQELSALAGSKEGQLRLGRVLGARLILKCDFDRLGNTEKLLVKMDDVETTERIPVPAVNLREGQEPESAVRALSAEIWQAAQSHYPLRGRIYQSANGLEINLGTSAGAKSGMVFDVLADKETAPIPGAQVTITGEPGASASAISASGFDAAGLGASAETGWYAVYHEQGSL